MNPEATNVVHSVNVWLPQTMTWLHTQIRALPGDIGSYVVSDAVTNLDQFPIDNLISADRDQWIWRKASALSTQITSHRRRQLLERAVDESGAEILHSHFGDRGWNNVGVQKRKALRHVVTFYGYDASRLPLDPVWQERFKMLFDSADMFLCEGPHLCATLNGLGCPVEKTRVHHLGVPVGSIAYAHRERSAGSPMRVLMAGTFVQKKGLPTAIRALGRVRKDLNLEVTLIGDSGGQPRMEQEKAEILRAVDESGLKDRIRLLGYRPHEELLRLAYEHDVFLSPSRVADDGDNEGGAPVSIIEMVATGIPVISTTHCDIPNVVLHDETGLLADENDVEQLAEHLLWLSRNSEAAAVFAARGRARVEAEFDAEKQGVRLRQQYLEVAGHRQQT